MAELVNRNIPLKWQIGWATDIGGGKENQDDFLVWEDKSSGTAVIAIFDGHGREVGKVAAQSAKEAMKKFLDENLSDLIATPTDALVAVHELAHTHIRNCFMDHFQRIGYEVKESDGYLLRRKLISENWSCIHGGTSCSVIAIVQSMMYIANVGDSTGILCSRRPVLCRSQMQYIRDSSLPSTVANNVSENREITMNAFKGCEKTMILTAEHSPECSYEYERLRLFRSREGDESLPSLRVIYDASSHDKSKCSTVFSNDSNGKLTLTNNGSYYKNVRKEWASLVSTPSYAKFQDALAFTRSLGDLHLSTYGVTHLPEVQSVDIMNVFSAIADSAMEGEPVETLCVVLASDGVWDNWQYEDVNAFVLDQSCVHAVMSSEEGAQRVAASFLYRNTIYAKRNFGSHADNATGIVLYLSCADQFPG